MSNNLILYNGPTSPFGRKVKIVSLVHEINLEEHKMNKKKKKTNNRISPK